MMKRKGSGKSKHSLSVFILRNCKESSKFRVKISYFLAENRISDLYYQNNTANDYAITSDGGTNYIPL